MEQIVLCTGHVSAVMNYRIVVDKELDNGLYEGFVFDKVMFWPDVVIGDKVRVMKSYNEYTSVIIFEKLN